MMLADDFEMQCTPEYLMQSLIEVYTYHFKQASDKEKRNAKDPETCYQVGKHDGAVEAIGAIMLPVFGGAMMYQIWEKTKEWATEKEQGQQAQGGNHDNHHH